MSDQSPPDSGSSRGRFITLEGSEGAGKSTQLQTLRDRLERAGIDHYVTREPGGTPMAEALREVMLSPWEEPVDGLSEALIAFAARRQHVNQEIAPRLAEGQWVISDRFTDATYAYQGAARGVAMDTIATLEGWVQGELRPDLTLYLDIEPEIGRVRIADREQDRMEQEAVDFFTRVRAGYVAQAEREARIVTIDASRKLDAVTAEVVHVVDAFIASAQGRTGR